MRYATIQNILSQIRSIYHSVLLQRPLISTNSRDGNTHEEDEEMERSRSFHGKTARSTVRRKPERASYDRETLAQILDEGLYCHVGFVIDGQPYVIPTVHARIDSQLYIHGSAASRMLRSLGKGIPACVTVTLLDGLVLARSVFHHSMNYRSAVILGAATEVSERNEKILALRSIVEHVIPGRFADARGPTREELMATTVLRMPIEEASAKIRTGPPIDDEEDYQLPYWAGEIPIRLEVGLPVPDSRLRSNAPLPEYVERYCRTPRGRKDP
jgi:nitroimidazol reductase NimA-like FMN-containing flavoprotein (pyridoxamine 5'-phosphate oxidase superfamily)